ncbi:MAG: DegT/DnrJ/EryC1/StrS aminotransferase family protein [Candidatus Delongbacteria bacterium]|nr:DegT/DnrJ/EryC1/StrS aminotransferase family protein [Candidatus Delongbacteria bacterium]
MINKKARDVESFRRVFYQTESAREAWKKSIEELKLQHPYLKVLLPAYIGWSKNEGSGIFDTVSETGVDFEFYGLNAHLEIDVEDLKRKVLINPNCLVLLVHYFGFVDESYEMIVTWLYEKSILFVEDCAHAWLSDLIGGKCGRRGRFSFYSLHKLLPVDNGGVLVDNYPTVRINENRMKTMNCFFNLDYDLFSIFESRRENYRYLCDLLSEIKDIDILHKQLPDGICPQTLPVIINGYDRNKCYQEMNSLGFGVISLYHTMIKELENTEYETVNVISKKILNFPIHQDIKKEHIQEMVRVFKKNCYGI